MDVEVQQSGSETNGRCAILSRDGVYRYRLWRSWGPAKRLAGVLLNPSTADGRKDDPTVRKFCGFAKRLGFDGIEILNPFSFRATDPASLWAAHSKGIDIIGPDNDEMIRLVLSRRSALAGAPAHPLMLAYSTPLEIFE